jgi:hypothetical protein
MSRTSVDPGPKPEVRSQTCGCMYTEFIDPGYLRRLPLLGRKCISLDVPHRCISPSLTWAGYKLDISEDSKFGTCTSTTSLLQGNQGNQGLGVLRYGILLRKKYTSLGNSLGDHHQRDEFCKICRDQSCWW